MYSTDLDGYVCTLSADTKGAPVEYSTNRVDLVFSKNEVGGVFRIPQEAAKEIRFSPRPGALPDFNERPDPYLTQHILIQAYDLAKGGRQRLRVYDWDRSWRAFCEYDITLELAEQEGVILPNGKFMALHFVQLQETAASTGFKKWPGSRTDVWVDDDLVILRIFRHREPYEVILQDYNNPKALISGELKAQGLTIETTTCPAIQERLKRMQLEQQRVPKPVPPPKAQ